MLLHAGWWADMKSVEGRNNLHSSFSVMDALNSCSWCGRVEGEVKSYEEEGNCFWCNDGLALEVLISWVKGVSTKGGTNLVEGGVGDKVGCKRTGGEKDRPGVVEDKWSLGEEVGCKGEGTEEGATGEEGIGSVEEGGGQRSGRQKEDQLGVVEHEGNGGGVGREGSLVNEGSLGEEEGSGLGFMGDMRR